MKRTRVFAAATCLGAVLVLAGCVSVFHGMVIQSETERLNKLRIFKVNLGVADCARLDELHAETEADKDALRDYDQRSDLLADAYDDKSCPAPDGLS